MDITPLIPKGRHVITGYGEGGFKINEEKIKGSLLVFAERMTRWDIAGAASLTSKDFEPLLTADPPVELLLIGTGASIIPLDPALRAFLKDRRIAVEVMDTGAACRTYNVLLSEERRVAAALVAV